LTPELLCCDYNYNVIVAVVVCLGKHGPQRLNAKCLAFILSLPSPMYM